jgi:hypothetical protein
MPTTPTPANIRAAAANPRRFIASLQMIQSPEFAEHVAGLRAKSPASQMAPPEESGAGAGSEKEAVTDAPADGRHEPSSMPLPGWKARAAAHAMTDGLRQLEAAAVPKPCVPDEKLKKVTIGDLIEHVTRESINRVVLSSAAGNVALDVTARQPVTGINCDMNGDPFTLPASGPDYQKAYRRYAEKWRKAMADNNELNRTFTAQAAAASSLISKLEEENASLGRIIDAYTANQQCGNESRLVARIGVLEAELATATETADRLRARIQRFVNALELLCGDVVA